VNTGAKMLNKILENKTQQHLKMIINHNNWNLVQKSKVKLADENQLM
jgi:hypothetical protein